MGDVLTPFSSLLVLSPHSSHLTPPSSVLPPHHSFLRIPPGDKQQSDANEFFNDELALQEGRRCFDFTMDLYGRNQEVSNLLTWDELWRVFEQAPYLGDSLGLG